jgi:hypothetical protein
MRNNKMANANKSSRNSRAGSVIEKSNTNRSELFTDQELTDQLDDVKVADPVLTTMNSQASFAPIDIKLKDSV